MFAPNASPQASVPPKAETVTSALDRHLVQLSEMAARIDKVCDRVFGPRPQDASAPRDGGRPVTSLASQLSDLSGLVGTIDDRILRLEHGL